METERLQPPAIASIENSSTSPSTPSSWQTALPDVLFWIVLVVMLAMGVQLFISGTGEPSMRMFAFVATMAIPVGTAYWGKRTHMWGPSAGALALMGLYWLSMNLGDLYTNY